MTIPSYLPALIVPAFLLFVLLEYLVAVRKGKATLFTYEWSYINISVGIAERLLNLFITGSFYALFQYAYNHFALLHIPNTWWVWVLLLLSTDLVWYWYHRLGHEINLFWGAHIVHHQSEEFNYTVSARITTLQAVIRNFFWCLLPVVGFHPDMVITILVVHGTYSFFTQTQVIGKLGWLEYVLITPSHHGVHHACNERYLNKNYGDIFVFWDKLFGTFQREDEKPVFGLTHPLRTKSFLWQHFHYYIELIEACRRSGSFIQSIKIIFGKPEDLDQGIREELEAQLLPPRHPFRATFRFKAYLNIQMLGTITGLFVYTWLFPELDGVQKFLGAFFLLITLINCGALLEQQRWIFPIEVVRVVSLCGAIAYAEESIGLFLTGLAIILALSSMDLIVRGYYRFVYADED
ncbi:MAG: sterol desaturase family protein [Cyclobacteriaceae bacterium]